jgi:hypothetical protein
MSVGNLDLFEVEEDEDLEVIAIVPEHSQPVQAVPVVDPSLQESLDSLLPHWFSVVVLTVPDVVRFPVPARFAAEKQPIDLAGLADLSGGEVRKLILPSLPDEQLDQIEAAEKSREKPRQMVLTAVQAEKMDRALPCVTCGHVSDQFSDWVTRTARNPLSCRIAAIAWQAGDGELVSFAPVGLEEEAAALADLRVAWAEMGSLLCRTLSSWDLNQTMAVVTARRNSLGIDCAHDDFYPANLSHGGLWVERANAIGGLADAAAVLGVAEHEIPVVLSPVDVFRMWRLQPGSTSLLDAAASQLSLEREMLQIVRTLW